ncbi:MAG: ROK family glucokinase [Micrococcales bacterium]|nr:ROK family glucokinase [Micrococcales bacterium]MBT5431957.1 ROK family glucokinase [Micrococcales bacterium]MBT5848549.1 ROK family glucokinase [Micrococcales bacterium]MBT7926232.1 ROK family glucokinase [Micrococcales bacterium]
MLSIGIDIGGTKVLGALVDTSGTVTLEKRIPSPAQDPDQMLEVVASLITELADAAGQELEAVGVAAAGFIDATGSTVLYAPNLKWRNEPLRERLEQRTKLAVVIENDANAAGWAEFRFGAGQGTKDMAMLTLGTGVGGAIISDGQLRRGGFGIAGELGHIRVVRDGRPCGCGRKGCVEQYASGTALLNAAKALVASNDPAAAMLAELSPSAEQLTGQHIAQALLAGDSGARALIEDLGQYLGEAMGSITAALDPEVYVIGGGLSEAGELVLEPIRRSFEAEVPANGFRPVAKVVGATFSNQAGVIGAADLARQSLR